MASRPEPLERLAGDPIHQAHSGPFAPPAPTQTPTTRSAGLEDLPPGDREHIKRLEKRGYEIEYRRQADGTVTAHPHKKETE